MRVKPVRDRIFVLPDEVIDKTESGIILSDFTKKRPTSGTIIAVGNEVTDFKPGDRVIYGEFCGHKEIMEYGGQDKEIFIMTPRDISGLIE